jgi:puromycin-sensitive aminopeptidase
MPPKKKDFRLPKDVRPLKYKLTLVPDLENFTFEGFVEIKLEVRSGTSCIVMNAADLDVKLATVTQDRKMQHASKVVLNPEKETVSIELATPLTPRNAYIDLIFTGTLNDNLCGFYRSKYTLPDGTERHMATTQFEAIDARRAFPCFDEPDQKATFDLALIVPEDRTAISNMPVLDELSLGDGKKVIRFETTPIMSTYLLAFTVGDLEYVEGKTKNNTLVRVFATPGKKQQCAFALDVGTRVLEYFEDYFGVPYPLPKLDMAAIPDFEPGAMENWGLVTFREAALLFDPEHSSTAAKQRVANIIAHELAHQWFGDLVTMAWWNDLWLNESFATLMGTKAVNHIFPEWKTWDQFYTGNTAGGLSLDGLSTSHPIEADIKNPKEIGQIFDAISYNKGASVLHMLEDYLGEDDFRKGVAQYLQKHQYGNAETKNLWDALEKTSGKPVSEIMDTWIKQTGYPIVEVSRSRYENYCGLEFSQKRFRYNPKNNAAKALWKVPINIGMHHGEGVAVLLESPGKKILMSASDRTPWIKVNAGQTGFFRVKYSPKMQEDLCQAMEQGELSARDRIGLANDAYALQRAGMMPCAQYLELAQSYRYEKEYPVWSELSSGLSGVMRMLTDEPCYEKLEAFARNIFAPVAQKMGWDARPDDDELAPMLRSLALGQMAHCDDKETVEEARQRFALLCQRGAVDPNLRVVVCNTAARHGGEATYNALIRLYRNATSKEEQIIYLRAMGQFRNKRLLSQTLAFAMSPEVRLENMHYPIVSAAGNPAGRDLTWEFTKSNWDELHDKFKHSLFSLGNIIATIVSGFTTPGEKEGVELFFAEHPIPEASMALAQSLERVDINIAWLACNRDLIAYWLKEQKGIT